MTDVRCRCGRLASAHLLADLHCPGFIEADPTDYITLETS